MNYPAEARTVCHNLAALFSLLMLTAAGSASAAVADLRITEVDPQGGQVEVTNTSVTTLTVASALPFFYRDNTSSVIAAGTEFAPGESKMFALAGLDPADSDLWLFKDSAFTDPASIITGLKWGPAAGVGKTSVAVTAGIWPSTSAFVAAQTSPSQSLRLTAYNSHLPANWAQGTPSPLAWFGTGTAIADPLPPVAKSALRIDLVPIATGLAAPVTVAQPDDASGRLFICDQAGKVFVHKNGTLLPEPLIDIASRLVSLRNYDERGLIGFAIHPNFAQNPKVYTYSSEPLTSLPATLPTPPVATQYDHQGVIAEWTMDPGNPDKVDMASRRELIRINEPQFNHNGGSLHFGPDGYFYLSLGDGGNSDDEGSGHLPGGNAQSLQNPLGKILRLQVDGGPFPNGRYGIPADNPFVGGPGLAEIWAYGMRNPYAFSFDSASGNLYLGDVGQNKVEEIDVVTKGANCGWHLKEGSFFFDPNGPGNGFVSTIPLKPLSPDLLEPIAEYDHDDGISIIGGYVYHGTSVPALQNRYVFGDFGTSFVSPSGKLFFLDTANHINQFTLGATNEPLGHWVKGFGQDQSGEMYVCASKTLGPNGTTGVVFKITGQTAVGDWHLYE